MSQETFKLRFLDGPRAGEEIPLADSLTTLGRSSDNTIVVDDASISRRHLTFYVEDEKVSVEDMGSSHGTTLNGQALQGRQVISHSDALQVGNHHISVVTLTETLNSTNRMDIFGHPDEIEEKFNSESEMKVRHVVKPLAQQIPNLDSQDEITGVFDFSEMQKGPPATSPQAPRDHSVSQVNFNDGTVPMAMPERTGPPKALIGILCLIIVLLLAALAYVFFFQDKGSPATPPPPGAPDFVAPVPAPTQ